MGVVAALNTSSVAVHCDHEWIQFQEKEHLQFSFSSQKKMNSLENEKTLQCTIWKGFFPHSQETQRKNLPEISPLQ